MKIEKEIFESWNSFYFLFLFLRGEDKEFYRGYDNLYLIL